jgi:hypothetical protein
VLELGKEDELAIQIEQAACSRRRKRLRARRESGIMRRGNRSVFEFVRMGSLPHCELPAQLIMP